MNRISMLAALAIAVTMAPLGAIAQDAFQGAVVYGLGGKFDKSFNEGIATGVVRFTDDTGATVREFEISNEAQRPQAIERAIRAGASQVIVAGFDMVGVLTDLAPKYPDTNFTIIDAVVEAPNVRSVVFREEQGSFLVGALAALTTETNRIGFVGGMDIPSIRRFACGYEAGAKFVNSDIAVVSNMVGTTAAAWSDPARAAALTRAQFDSASDIVYAAAGGSSLGVYQAAADAGKLAIGVDNNVNYLHPGTMLTSMVKRVDEAAYLTLEESAEGTWTPGKIVYGLDQGGVSWALDEFNRELVSPEAEAQLADIQAKIVSGEIQVHDYVIDNTCKAD